MKTTIVLLLLACIPMAKGRDVYLDNYCDRDEDDSGYDISVGYFETLTLIINSDDWSGSGEICSIVFKANDGVSDLVYRFTEYDSDGEGDQIVIKSAFVSFYTTEATYSDDAQPPIGVKFNTNILLKIIVSRSVESAEIEIFIDGGLRTGALVGVVLGVFAGVSLLSVSIGCYVVRSKSKKSRGTVVAVGRQNVALATTGVGSPVYPYSSPPESLAVHPGYPMSVGQPGYLVQNPQHAGQTAYPMSFPPQSYTATMAAASQPAQDSKH